VIGDEAKIVANRLASPQAADPMIRKHQAVSANPTAFSSRAPRWTNRSTAARSRVSLSSDLIARGKPERSGATRSSAWHHR